MAVEALADDHRSAVKPVLSPALLRGPRPRRPSCTPAGCRPRPPPSARTGCGFWVRSAAPISAPLNVDHRPRSGSPHRSLADELVLAPAVTAPRELLAVGPGRSQLEAHDGRLPQLDLRTGDLLQRRRGERVAVGDQRVHEAAVLAEAHQIPGGARGRVARDGHCRVLHHAAEDASVFSPLPLDVPRSCMDPDRGLRLPTRPGLITAWLRPK